MLNMMIKAKYSFFYAVDYSYENRNKNDKAINERNLYFTND